MLKEIILSGIGLIVFLGNSYYISKIVNEETKKRVKQFVLAQIIILVGFLSFLFRAQLGGLVITDQEVTNVVNDNLAITDTLVIDTTKVIVDTTKVATK